MYQNCLTPNSTKYLIGKRAKTDRVKFIRAKNINYFQQIIHSNNVVLQI